MKPLVTTQDTERIVRDVLAARMAERGETATVSIGVPTAWTTASGSHVQINSDGTPIAVWPVYVKVTIRVVGWSSSTTESKRLAGLCLGLLMAYPGDGAMSGVEYLTGPQTARDADTRAELCYVTAAVTVRTVPVV